MQQNIDNKSKAGKFFVPALTIAFCSTWIADSITSIFLVDLATTFFGESNTFSIATTSQLPALSSIVSVIFGVILGILSVRYDHKKLLVFGVLSIILGTLGCYFAPNFLFMQIFFPIEGIGTIIVSGMSLALVGEFLSLKKRPKATGWLLAGASIAGLASAIVIKFFFATTTEAWRSFLLWFALPISLISLVAVSFGVPSAPQKLKTTGKEAYLRNFKQIFLKKSSAFCMVANMIRHTAIAYSVVFSVSYFRDETQFNLSLADGALFTLGNLTLFTLGSIIGGHLIDRIGRKRQIVVMLVIASPILMLAAFETNLWLSIALNYLFFFVVSMGYPASMSLTLEQAPESRGTMMSINTIFITLGFSLGAAIGSAVLRLGGWTILIVTFAVLSLIAAAIYFFFVKDPCISMQPKSTKLKSS